MVRYHFSPTTVAGAFDRLRSVQFDPLSPVGCNHDLVLQTRVKGYKIGDWQKFAYEDRFLYGGWDKEASLVPYSGWPVRRIVHKWHRKWHNRMFEEYPHAVDAVLSELSIRGPLLPKEFEFQEHKPEWRTSWHGPNLTKQTLRALWHSGLVMTHGRRGGHHVYDLTERIVPASLLALPLIDDAEAVRELVKDRHRAVGLLRPNAQSEVWSFDVSASVRHEAISELVSLGELVPVEVEGVKSHAPPEFLACLDSRKPSKRVVFLAPLDQFMWDRKMIAHIFRFDYVWEVYVPEQRRKWGYYVLPVLFGEEIVARVEFWSRAGALEMRVWHWEAGAVLTGFWPAFEKALVRFMGYAGAKSVSCSDTVDDKVKGICASVSANCWKL